MLRCNVSSLALHGIARTNPSILNEDTKLVSRTCTLRLYGASHASQSLSSIVTQDSARVAYDQELIVQPERSTNLTSSSVAPCSLGAPCRRQSIFFIMASAPKCEAQEEQQLIEVDVSTNFVNSCTTLSSHIASCGIRSIDSTMATTPTWDARYREALVHSDIPTNQTSSCVARRSSATPHGRVSRHFIMVFASTCEASTTGLLVHQGRSTNLASNFSAFVGQQLMLKEASEVHKGPVQLKRDTEFSPTSCRAEFGTASGSEDILAALCRGRASCGQKRDVSRGVQPGQLTLEHLIEGFVGSQNMQPHLLGHALFGFRRSGLEGLIHRMAVTHRRVSGMPPLLVWRSPPLLAGPALKLEAGTVSSRASLKGNSGAWRTPRVLLLGHEPDPHFVMQNSRNGLSTEEARDLTHRGIATCSQLDETDHITGIAARSAGFAWQLRWVCRPEDISASEAEQAIHPGGASPLPRPLPPPLSPPPQPQPPPHRELIEQWSSQVVIGHPSLQLVPRQASIIGAARTGQGQTEETGHSQGEGLIPGGTATPLQPPSTALPMLAVLTDGMPPWAARSLTTSAHDAQPVQVPTQSNGARLPHSEARWRLLWAPGQWNQGGNSPSPEGEARPSRQSPWAHGSRMGFVSALQWASASGASLVLAPLAGLQATTVLPWSSEVALWRLPWASTVEGDLSVSSQMGASKGGVSDSL